METEGHDTDVQPGQGNQMSGTGLAQQIPLLAREIAAVTHGQGLDQTGVAATAAEFAQALDDAIAPGRQRPAALLETFGGRFLAHPASGIDTALPQPALVVEGAGIEIAMGLAQTQRQAPDLSGPKGRWSGTPAQSQQSGTRGDRIPAFILEPLQQKFETLVRPPRAEVRLALDQAWNGFHFPDRDDSSIIQPFLEAMLLAPVVPSRSVERSGQGPEQQTMSLSWRRSDP